MIWNIDLHYDLFFEIEIKQNENDDKNHFKIVENLLICYYLFEFIILFD